jgi:hypothetical protein
MQIGRRIIDVENVISLSSANLFYVSAEIEMDLDCKSYKLNLQKKNLK